jgi:TonB family protein
MNIVLAQPALAIAATVVNGLWEGVLIVAAVWLGLRCLSNVGAATRYAVWLFALAALVIIPMLTVGVSGQPPEPIFDAGIVSAQSRASVTPVAQLRIDATRPAPDPAVVAAEPSAAPRKAQIALPQSLAVVAAFAWMLIVCLRALRLFIDARNVAAVRRTAWLWSGAHPYPVLLSNRVQVPIAVGFLRPAIILPASLVDQLDDGAIEAIVTHEVAHLRRYDVWTNALARVAEIFVTLNPIAWFVMRQLSIEREIACDDWVVARAGSGDAFAHVLAGLATRARCRVPLAAPSALGSRHSIVRRIERLLDARPRRLRPSPSALGATMMVLALVAFLVQSVSPVFAYQPHPILAAAPAAPATGTCTVPNHGIRMAGFPGLKARHGRSPAYPMPYELKTASEIVSKLGAANVVTVDLTVDATGAARKVAVISASRYPGMAERVTRMLTNTAYEPATRNCVPVTATIRTAQDFGTPRAGAFSIVTPVYPSGWSAQHASACKVPEVLHWTLRPDGPATGLPVFPDAMKNVSVDATYRASVHVHVNAAGVATNAAVVSSSGQPAFDDALVAAARQATYPLTEDTGFKPVRPSGAPLSWNAANGSKAYGNCKPLPTDYVWHTLFRRTVPFGIPPGSGSEVFGV